MSSCYTAWFRVLLCNPQFLEQSWLIMCPCRRGLQAEEALGSREGKADPLWPSKLSLWCAVVEGRGFPASSTLLRLPRDRGWWPCVSAGRHITASLRLPPQPGVICSLLPTVQHPLHPFPSSATPPPQNHIITRLSPSRGIPHPAVYLRCSLNKTLEIAQSNMITSAFKCVQNIL